MMPGSPYIGNGMGGMMNPMTPGQLQMQNQMMMYPNNIGNTLPNYQPGQAYTTLPYEWITPRHSYEVNPGWNGYELASAHYNGGNGFERSWFDDMVCSNRRPPSRLSFIHSTQPTRFRKTKKLISHIPTLSSQPPINPLISLT
jgi:hypothetical protein